MEGLIAQKFGPACGKHGSCTFYKAFKYTKNGESKIITLGQFFFMKILKGIPICMGELQLVWEDKNSAQDLASLRLYFLPECTPDGRQAYHGEDEVLAYSEKIVLKLDDIATLMVRDVTWSEGRRAFTTDKLLPHSEHGDLAEAFKRNSYGVVTHDIDVAKESIEDKEMDTSPDVTIMTYPKYCRYRCVLKRLENCADKWMRNAIVCALGGFSSNKENNRIYFCRDTFEDSNLDDFELRCDHLAPNLKGRPRKRKGSKQGTGNDSSEESSCSSSLSSQQEGVVNKIRTGARDTPLRNGFRVDKIKVSKDEQAFLIDLHKLMQSRGTPIGRIPSLGFKQIDLYQFYILAEEIGGYEQITDKRLWKNIYDTLGGSPGSTSAATYTRRHYEKLLLPYERYKMGKDIKPSHCKKKKIKTEMEPFRKSQEENKREQEEKELVKVKKEVKEEPTLSKNDPYSIVNGNKVMHTNFKSINLDRRAIIKQEIAKMKMKKVKEAPKVCKTTDVVNSNKVIHTSHKRVEMDKRALIIKQEIAKMKMRKDARKHLEKEMVSDRERLWDDRRKYKWGEKVRKPSGGQKTVRELLDENGKDVNDNGTDKLADFSNDQKPDQVTLISHELKQGHENNISFEKDKKDIKMTDLKLPPQSVPGTVTVSDPRLHQPALLSPLNQQRPMFYPQFIPMGGAIRGVTPMAMPFMIPQFGIQTVTNPVHVMQSAASTISKESNPILSSNKLMHEHKDIKHIPSSMDNSAILIQNSSNHSRVSNISPQCAPPSNHVQPPKGPLTSPQTNASYQRPITPAHTNGIKRSFSYLDSNRHSANFAENTIKRESMPSDTHVKRQRAIGSPPSDVLKSNSEQLDVPVLDLSMKTLRAQEARQQRGESLLFNTSFNKENKSVKSEQCDGPQDLSMKSVQKFSPYTSSDLTTKTSLASSAPRNVPLNIPKLQTDQQASAGARSNTDLLRSDLNPKNEKQELPSSLSHKVPPVGVGAVPNIGGLPIDLGAFVHPAFPQQMLMQGIFPTPLQLQQMIQGQVAAGLPLLRPEFIPSPMMFPSTLSTIPPSLFSTIPPTMSKASNSTANMSANRR